MSLLSHAKQQIAHQVKYRHLNAFVSLANHDAILARAQFADASCIEGERSLRGKLIAIKDNICTMDLPTTAASGILGNFQSPYDATVVRQLRDAGAIIAGKTNMDEFGMGSHNMHSRFGKTFCEGSTGPQSAGGSSGGSAVAVATGQCWAALGTDTGGSVRLPAAYTGIVGFKPSYGLLSRWGVIAYANSLDTVGVLGGSVRSVRGIFNTLNSHDPQDPTSLPQSSRARLGSGPCPTGRLKIGIPVDCNIQNISPVVRHAWLSSLLRLQERGHSLHPITLPAFKHALSAYYVLAPAEASSNLAKYDGVRFGSRAQGKDGTPNSVLYAKSRGEGFGAEVQRRILLGAFSLSAGEIDNYFIQAQRVRRILQQDFNEVFALPNPLLSTGCKMAEGGVDVLLCPTAPTPAPPLSEINSDPLQAYTNDVFTVPASLAGLPAISVPVKVTERASAPLVDTAEATSHVGMQIIGQYGDDDAVLRAAEELHEASWDDE